jgi:hypothetical protein
VTLGAVRAAWWTWRTLPRLRGQLSAGKLERVSVTPPPRVPAHAVRGVEAVLRRRENSCLERAILLQRWHVAHGDALDVVIGVTPPGDAFRAHAWLANEPAADPSEFAELFRLKP